MFRLSVVLLLGVLAVTVPAIGARSHVYEREWKTGVPGVVGHSVFIVQDNLGEPTVTGANDNQGERLARANAAHFLAWAHKQFEMLAQMQSEGASDKHAVVLVNGIPMHVVVHSSGETQTQNIQDVEMARTGQEAADLDEEFVTHPDYENAEDTTESYFDACIWRVMVVSLMVACACTFFACVKHACDIRRAAIETVNKKVTITSEKVPLLTVLAPEGMAKEPAVIHVTSADSVHFKN